MHTTSHQWPRWAMTTFALLSLNACTGERIGVSLGAQLSKHPHDQPPTQPHSGAVVIEAPWQAEESELSDVPRLLGGMQQSDDSDDGDADVKKDSDTKTQQLTAATRYGLRPQEIDRDGNCLFRAIADQLQREPFNIQFSTHEDYHRTIRRIAVEHVRSHRAVYESNFPYGPFKSLDDWLGKMDQDKAWGDQVAIRALADALQVTIVAVRAEATDGEKPTIYKPAQPSGIVYLHYRSGNHYESLTKFVRQ